MEATNKCLEALDFALKFEREGKEFYEKAAKITDNPLGKEIFQTLAKEEVLHMKKIEEVYQNIEKEGGWDQRITAICDSKLLKTAFAEAMEKIDTEIKASTSDLDALKKAMEMEERGENLYKDLADKAVDPLEKRFYLTLSVEERSHFLVILDSYDYLSDPSGWFAKKERSGLDGG